MAEPQAPHELPEPTIATVPDNDAPEVVDVPGEGLPATESVAPEVQEALYEAFGPQSVEEEAGRERDAQGRFLPKDAPEVALVAEEAPKPQLDPAWAQAARDVYFSKDEIAAFSSEVALQEAVLGRQVRIAQRAGFQAPQPVQQQPDEQPAPKTGIEALENFTLGLDESTLPDEYTGPLRAIEQHVNQLKETLGAENADLRQQLAGMQGHVKQSARSAQEAQLTQYVQEWDKIAAAVPGMVEAMGRPSEARQKAGSVEHHRWLMIQPVVQSITDRYMQVVGAERIDHSMMQRIAQEAFEQAGFSPLTQQVPTSNGRPVTPGPGAVVAAPSRRADAGEPGMDEYDRAVATVAKQWDRAGGNPYR